LVHLFDSRHISLLASCRLEASLQVTIVAAIKNKVKSKKVMCTQLVKKSTHLHLHMCTELSLCGLVHCRARKQMMALVSNLHLLGCVLVCAGKTEVGMGVHQTTSLSHFDLSPIVGFLA
jgi:hypothetical protein